MFLVIFYHGVTKQLKKDCAALHSWTGLSSLNSVEIQKMTNVWALCPDLVCLFVCFSPEKFQHLWEHKRDVPSVRETFLPQHRVGLLLLKQPSTLANVIQRARVEPPIVLRDLCVGWGWGQSFCSETQSVHYDQSPSTASIVRPSDVQLTEWRPEVFFFSFEASRTNWDHFRSFEVHSVGRLWIMNVLPVVEIQFEV